MKIIAFLIVGLFCGHTALQAQTTYAAGACTAMPNSKRCIDTTPCKQATTGESVCLSTATNVPTGALVVPQSCWQYSYTFACENASSGNTCSALESNAACGLISSSCTDTAAATGTCTGWAQTYQCQTKAATTQSQTTCTSGALTPLALPTPTNTNNTFQKAAIAQEIASQAQMYSKNGQNAFMGVGEFCTLGYGGIKDCCKSVGGAKSNSVVFGIALGAAASGIKYIGEKAVAVASPYVYDAMYNVGMWTQGMENAQIFANGSDMFGSAAASGFSVGAYGFTVGTGAVSGSTTILAGGADGYIAFNPYALAALIAIQYLQSLASCSDEERMLMMHRGASLSVQTGENCSNKIPIIGTCIEYTRSFCSFNSVLAKIINQQGKAQLGRGFNDCSGFTLQDLSTLDFSKMDFSEFTSQMTSQAISNQPTNTKGNYTPVMNSTTQGSSQKQNQGLAYPQSTTP